MLDSEEILNMSNLAQDPTFTVASMVKNLRPKMVMSLVRKHITK